MEKCKGQKTQGEIEIGRKEKRSTERTEFFMGKPTGRKQKMKKGRKRRI